MLGFFLFYLVILDKNEKMSNDLSWNPLSSLFIYVQITQKFVPDTYYIKHFHISLIKGFTAASNGAKV